MRTLAAVLLCLCALPVFAQDKMLTNEQILAQADEATAAELRWILRCNFFAENAVGFDGEYLRQTTAYLRLLRAKDTVEFERLLLSNNDTAVCFGIAGLRELNAAKLLPHLPTLALRQATVTTGSGCIVGRTTVAAEALQAIRDTPRADTLAAVQLAWQAWLAHLAANPDTADYQCANAFRELLGELVLPPAAGAEVEQALQFLAVLADDDTASLRKHALAPALPLLARLCMRELVRRGAYVADAIIQSVWLRELDGDEAALDLRIAVEQRRQICEHMLSIEVEDGVSRSIESPFRAMTAADWQWLKEHDHSGIRQAAQALSEDPIVGWSIDKQPGTEAKARAIWMLCAIFAATSDRDPAAPRVCAILAKRLKSDPGLLDAAVLGLRWGARPVSTMLTGIVEPSRLLEVAKAAVLAPEPGRYRAGLGLIVDLVQSSAKRAAVWRAEGMDVVRTRLFKEAAGDTSECWPTRSALLALSGALEDVDAAFAKSVEALRINWCATLARTLVGQPRTNPPEMHYFTTTTAFEHLDDRAGVLCTALYEGGTHFLPDDELEHVEAEEVDEPGLVELLKRMRTAAAKLK